MAALANNIITKTREESATLRKALQCDMKAENKNLKAEMVLAVKAAIEASQSKMKELIKESEAKVQAKITSMENILTRRERGKRGNRSTLPYAQRIAVSREKKK
jgi:uncharacterized protein YajQ (UPF0234 family)